MTEKCSDCGMELHYEDDEYDQDEAYEIDERLFCHGCFFSYCENTYFKRLKAS